MEILVGTTGVEPAQGRSPPGVRHRVAIHMLAPHIPRRPIKTPPGVQLVPKNKEKPILNAKRYVKKCELLIVVSKIERADPEP